ncbi:hypothetical protein [Streptomyces collinus]|uniref:hypothetical protein n=1 Tax=Streptomyces collinus TaxID=42684 RepID=UPI002941CA5F|nr:hypothetical protein [Streptomyces collinus]
MRPATNADHASGRNESFGPCGIHTAALRSQSYEDPYALVDLGRCNLTVASRPAVALNRVPVEPAPPEEVLRERVRRLNQESVRGVT